jgi:mRNA-degrading endonuclease toxin of MazEF toxin-antitoxin module
MNRGDIVLITFPFSDLSSTKVRPVLVLSPKEPDQQDFIVTLITSNIVTGRGYKNRRRKVYLFSCFYLLPYRKIEISQGILP